ncbi:MAG: hypothetical protein Q7S21_02825 [archaeon]|nr:hypothetical protein [archaeon]
MKKVDSKTKQVQLDESKEKAWGALFAARGIFKENPSRFRTIEQWHQWKLDNSEKFVKELDKKFKIKS